MNNPKLTKLTNQELMNSILKVMQDMGYTIKDVVMGNCYFLFEEKMTVFVGFI